MGFNCIYLLRCYLFCHGCTLCSLSLEVYNHKTHLKLNVKSIFKIGVHYFRPEKPISKYATITACIPYVMFCYVHIFEYCVYTSYAGASLGYQIHGCQNPTLRPKASLKPHFWGIFRHFFLNQRVPKGMFSNRRVPWHPWHPC